MKEWSQRAVRKRPWFWGAIAAVLGLLLWSWLPWIGWASTLIMGVLGFLLWGWRGGLYWGVGSAVVLTSLVWSEASRIDTEAAMLASRHGTLEAVVLRDARGGEGAWSAMARVLRGRWAGSMVWWQGGGVPPVAGAQISGSGDFQSLPVTRNAGEFDRAEWLRLHGVSAVFDCRSRIRVDTSWLASWGAGVKREFRERVGFGLDPASVELMVLRAVVIGEAPQDADPVVAAFRESGTLHAFSVSGLHVAMVGTLGWWVLSRLGMRRSWAVLVLIPLVFAYSWITGNSAPAVRSAWMAALFLAAFPLRRRADLLNTLGIVLWVGLLLDARMLFLPGVQLSYGVVAAIAIGAGFARKLVSWIDQSDPYLPKSECSRGWAWWLEWRGKLAQSLAVGLAAGLGSSPLTALHFGMVTPISVLAGLVLIPLVFVMLIGSFAVVVLSPMGAPAKWLNQVNARVAALSVATAKGFAAIPGGHFSTRVETESTLRVFDLDRGAGALCFSGGRAAVLLDAGNRTGFRYRVVPALRYFGLEPDSVVFSHPDGAHLGGGALVWESFPVRQVIFPVMKSLSPVFREWQRAAATTGMNVIFAKQGERLPLPDGAWMEILHVADPHALQSLADERVMVIRLHWGAWKILYTSDAGQNTEDAMLASGRDLGADGLVIGRHRSGLTLGESFLRAIGPQFIIAGNDAFPEGERLPMADVEFWRSLGVQVFDQEISGGITMKMLSDGKLTVSGHVDGSEVILHEPGKRVFGVENVIESPRIVK